MNPALRQAPYTLLMVGSLWLSACDYKGDGPTAPPGAFIELTSEDRVTTLPADGLSRLTLIARVASLSAERIVVFSTSEGMLLGSGSPAQSKEIQIDGQGEARVQLQSGTLPTQATVTASVKNRTSVSASLRIEFQAQDGSSIVSFSEAPTRAPADGSTASEFAITVSSLLEQSEDSITVTTSLGSFQSGSDVRQLQLDPASNRVARFFLYSPRETGTAIVRAVVASQSAETQIRFETALAESLRMNALSPAVATSASVVVEAVLSRSTGSVTKGTAVNFSARDANGIAIGQFLSATPTDSTGKATAVFYPRMTAYRGPVSILAEEPVSGIAGVVQVEITDDAADG